MEAYRSGGWALTALLLAAVITERDNTHEGIKRVCARLEKTVAEIEPHPEYPPVNPPS
ncbi:hypothetical protein ABZ958_09150 [Streptomyces sp. NPDC046237]|uniref:hypothetical protein n=1 Tax=Streptomyces sp. NPDC046237 TaxID=3154914 RepID=UPI0033CD52F1